MLSFLRIKLIITLFFGIGFELLAQNPIPKVEYGKIERIQDFKSKYVSSRNIDIWLPDGYSRKKKYAVLYMHDGQMLFDPEITWNKQSWNVDSIANAFIQNQDTKNFIVVAIWNGGITRHADYFPQNPYEKLSPTEKDTVISQLKKAGRISATFTPNSDNYLRFIVNELRPYINNTYSVSTKKSETFIAGSSMGGLISIYAICEYPKIFGGAACISTHWPGTFTLTNNPLPQAIIDYLKHNLPSPKNHRIYFDCGDQTLDALYPDIQLKIDLLMKEKGFSSKNWLTKYFPGENHSEQSWRKRLDIPLKFLLK
jgi:predicted alpha/beta superfamily hydrolase